MTNFDFKRVSELAPAEASTTCVYGASGAGKTEFSATAPRALIINTGNGEETLKGADFKARRKVDPLIVSIIDKQDDKKLWTGYYAVCDVIDVALKTMSDQFDTVVLDDLSAFRRFAMNSAIDMNGEAERSKTVFQAKEWNIALPTQSDWGTEKNFVTWFATTYMPILKAANKHLIVIAHDRLTFTKAKKGEDARLIAVSPSVTGADKNPDEFAQYFDNVWHLSKAGRTTYKLQTQGDAIVRAKTRIGGVLKEVEENPNFSDLLARLQSGKLLNAK